MKEPREIVVDGDLAYITLTKGYVAVIDSADVELVSGFHWHTREKFHPNGKLKCAYAMSSNERVSIYLHRLLLKCPAGLIVDHKDCDGLNNRRSNLRIATCSQNSRNQRYRTDNTSGVKGVAFHKDTGKWQAFIRADNKQLYLGLFVDKESAAAARASASRTHYGEFKRDE